MKKAILITILFLYVSASVKAQTINAELITNVKQGDPTAVSDITDISGTIPEGGLLYDSTRKAIYIYNGTQWRKLYFGPLISEQTGNYTLQDSDDGNVITFNSVADVTLTVPAGLDVGFNVSIYQLGTGKITITPSGGATVNNRLSRFVTAGQNAGAGIICTASNVYHVTGDLKKS